MTDGPTPTPSISYAVVDIKAAGAINITASHNPGEDCGFKVRDEFGGAIPPVGLDIIESLIPDSVEDVKRMKYGEAEAAGLIAVMDKCPAIEYGKR